MSAVYKRRMTVHTESENRYVIGPGDRPPELHELPGVASVVNPEERSLETTYFDTSSLTLTGAGITVRRRVGGDDAGWHVQLPTVSGEYDVHEPLAPARKTVPKRLLDVVEVLVRGEALSPVATVATQRIVHRLMDVENRVLAEVADDWVTSEVVGVEERSVSSRYWHEVVVELVAGEPHLRKAAADWSESNGLVRSSSASKLADALEGRMPARPSRALPTKKSDPPMEVVHAWLFDQLNELRQHDPLVRADAPDAVHTMRVATRRLRSAFATFRPLLDRDITDPVREELKWIAGVLGEARDAEVMHQRLSDMLSAEDPVVVRGSAGTRVDRALRDRYTRAHAECVRAMTSARYFALVDRLDELQAEPPWRADAQDNPPTVLTDRVRHDWKRLERRVRSLDDSSDAHDRAGRIHDVRKAAKRVRYAAEPLVAQYGKPAKRFVKATKRMQSVLGDHQDSIVTQTELRKLADSAAADDDDAFTFGALHAREDLNQEMTQVRIQEAWVKASKKKRRSWLR